MTWELTQGDKAHRAIRLDFNLGPNTPELDLFLAFILHEINRCGTLFSNGLTGYGLGVIYFEPQPSQCRISFKINWMTHSWITEVGRLLSISQIISGHFLRPQKLLFCYVNRKDPRVIFLKERSEYCAQCTFDAVTFTSWPNRIGWNKQFILCMAAPAVLSCPASWAQAGVWLASFLTHMVTCREFDTIKVTFFISFPKRVSYRSVLAFVLRLVKAFDNYDVVNLLHTCDMIEF